MVVSRSNRSSATQKPVSTMPSGLEDVAVEVLVRAIGH